MRAALVTRFGGPEVLQLVDREAPTPGPGELLLRVEAVGLNWSDLLQREGAYPGGPTPPFVTGQEAAGVVVAHGEGVSEPPIGARVAAIADSGLGAELAVVRADSCFAWDQTAEQRAALPIAMLTAYHVLATNVRRGKTVLIHAAAGGLGHIATQVAYHLGLRTIGTASAAKRADVHADAVCGYEDLRTAAPDGVDLVLDGVGGEAYRASVNVLREGGRIVIVGASSGQPQRIDPVKLVHRSHAVIGFHLRHLLADREALARAIETCRSMPVTARVTMMRLAEISNAHARLSSREISGKLVLVP